MENAKTVVFCDVMPCYLEEGTKVSEPPSVPTLGNNNKPHQTKQRKYVSQGWKMIAFVFTAV